LRRTEKQKTRRQLFFRRWVSEVLANYSKIYICRLPVPEDTLSQNSQHRQQLGVPWRRNFIGGRIRKTFVNCKHTQGRRTKFIRRNMNTSECKFAALPHDLELSAGIDRKSSTLQEKLERDSARASVGLHQETPFLARRNAMRPMSQGPHTQRTGIGTAQIIAYPRVRRESP
jgi:hypothetical protein